MREIVPTHVEAFRRFHDMTRKLCAAVLLIGFSTLAGAAAPAPDSSGWAILGNGSDGQFFSPLRQINTTNVSKLGLAWYADIPTQDGLLGNALVADSVVYQSGALSRIWANDLRTGKLLWQFDPHIHFDGKINVGWAAKVNRGLALWGEDLAIVGTADCRLVAVNRRSGAKVWDTISCDNVATQTITGAPRVGGGKVFIGSANLDSGVSRGHIDAFDAATGRHLWRFYTVPGDPAKGFENKAMEMAASTWEKDWWKTTAGATVWEGITYDSELNQVYFGTDGAQPQNPAERGPPQGDELFTNAIVAVNADTGQYVWHYSTTPNDGWDYNADMPLVVANLNIAGGRRRVVMQAPKNGFFYVLDARTGRLLGAKNLVPVNWASSVDLKTGRPVELPAARYSDQPGKPVVVQPGGWGAHNWQAMSFNPTTGLVYLPVSPLPMIVTLTQESAVIGGHVHLDWLTPLQWPEYKGKAGELVAWDPRVGRARWRVSLPMPANGGVISTAGGLVFGGAASGEFRAYSADTGAQLWSLRTGSSIEAAPTTVMVDGKQIVLVPAGIGGGFAKLVPEFLGTEGNGPARLLAFTLGGTATLPAVAPESPFPKPPRVRPKDAALIARGRSVFNTAGCDNCHGADAKRHVGPDSIPDLRRASAQTHDQFAAIVIGGLRKDKGMPVFTDTVSISDLTALQAFILSQAWDAHEATNGAASRR
jgi:quinohemoprotein ethanol dehydrogenase